MAGDETMEKVRVGLVGSQFVSTIHAESLKQVPRAELVAVASGKKQTHFERGTYEEIMLIQIDGPSL